MRVLRFDSGELVSFKETANGYLAVKLRITKPGVFPYYRPEGLRRELRRPETLKTGEFIDSVQNCALTHEHPVKNGKFINLDSSTTPEFITGYPKGKLEFNGIYPEIDAVIFDQNTIENIKAGKVEISMGSYCTPVEEAGVFEGQSFDREQTNVICNHIAITSKGRVGPDVRIISSADNAAIEVPDGFVIPCEEENVKITIGGKTFDVPDDVAAAIQAEKELSGSTISSLQHQASTLQTSLDSVKSDLETEKQKSKEMEGYAKQMTTVAMHARDYLTDEQILSIDSFDTRSIQIAVMKTAMKDFDFSSKSNAEINSQFEMFCALQPKKVSSADSSGADGDLAKIILGNRGGQPRSNDNSFNYNMANEAKAKAMAAQKNRWKSQPGS